MNGEEIATAEDAVAAFNAATHAVDPPQKIGLQQPNYFEDNSNNKDNIIDRRYTCDTCNQSFTRKHNLKSHIQIHTNGKQFKCTECNLTFRRGYDLKRHSKTHTKERPFRCTHCGKGFARGDALLRHSNSSSNCSAEVNDSEVADLEQLPKRHKVKHQSDTVGTVGENVEAAKQTEQSVDTFENIIASLNTTSNSLHSCVIDLEETNTNPATLETLLKLSATVGDISKRIKLLNSSPQ